MCVCKCTCSCFVKPVTNAGSGEADQHGVLYTQALTRLKLRSNHTVLVSGTPTERAFDYLACKSDKRCQSIEKGFNQLQMGLNCNHNCMCRR